MELLWVMGIGAIVSMTLAHAIGWTLQNGPKRKAASGGRLLRLP